MKKNKYFIDSNYNYKETISSLMDKMRENVRSDLYNMYTAFQNDDTAKAYEYYNKAFDELKMFHFRQAENTNNTNPDCNYETVYNN